MTTAASPTFPFIDAAKQTCITPEQAQFFRDYGLLHIRNLLQVNELNALREQTLPLVQKAMATKVDDRDYVYKKHRDTGKEVPFRIEYVIDKTTSGKALLGHPFILQSIQLLQGRNFLPTWDSMVFKLEGMGAEIAWHRDSQPYPENAADIDHPVSAINVDFYLDGSDLSNCLWGILGSNRWNIRMPWKPSPSSMGATSLTPRARCRSRSNRVMCFFTASWRCMARPRPSPKCAG
ncbi:MAG: phytanoyl-CoA dioxygenase family protein [Phycisphaerales bacterium]|nr:phytanoyl-CoA dioxygenase family protein [Phycisphaerales bacterium]